VRDALAGLEVDADRMRANLDLTQGLLMAESLATALALHIGKPSAQLIVQVACEQAQANTSPLLEIALATPELTAHLRATEIERALDPLTYLGSTDAFIDRALDGYRQMLAEVEQR
jgi:3-carboxy-cis,cis-muconate cycloisomerase